MPDVETNARRGRPVVTEVEAGSLAEAIGVRVGDAIVAINGTPVQDVIDYKFLLAAERVRVRVERPDQSTWEVALEKPFDQELGVQFAKDVFDGVHICKNHCVFCFVHQTPRGMRKSLYVMDDDYRLSFLHGHFVTLTNLTEAEKARIVEQRLSPLHVSVHATDDDVRVRLMGTERARGILGELRRLIESGIELHTQIVACPGLNDGPHLERTIADLASLGPRILSISVVPVGLTAYRERLYHLEPYDARRAGAVIDQLAPWQRRFLAERGTRLAWASDEFYCLAGRSVPPASFYEDFAQLENGVGMIRRFRDQLARATRPSRFGPAWPSVLARPRRFTVVTGTSAAPTLRWATDRLARICGAATELVVVENDWFGHSVTVAGLLTARDIAARLAGRPLGEFVAIPRRSLKLDDDIFLDDVRLSELESQLGVPVVPAETGQELTRLALFGRHALAGRTGARIGASLEDTLQRGLTPEALQAAAGGRA